MQPKTDFTFVLPSNTQTGMYQKVNIEDVDGKECKLSYQEIEKLEFLCKWIILMLRCGLVKETILFTI